MTSPTPPMLRIGTIVLSVLLGSLLCPSDVRAQGNAQLVITNNTKGTISLFWLNRGREEPYGKIAPGETIRQPTFAGHRWVLRDDKTKGLLRNVQAAGGNQNVRVDPPKPAPNANANLTLVNKTTGTVNVFWLNAQKQEQAAGSIRSGGAAKATIAMGSQFVIRDQAGKELQRITVNKATQEVEIRGGTPPGRNPELVLVNKSKSTLQVFWLNFEKKEQSYGELKPEERMKRITGIGHVWIIRDKSTGKEVKRVTVSKPSEEVSITVQRKDPTPVMVTVPSLTGLNRTAADAKLKQLGLVPNGVAGNADSARANIIYAQLIAANTKVKVGTVVSYAYFKPVAPPTTVNVPNLLSLTQVQAEATLKNVGLVPKGSAGNIDSSKVGQVYAQSLAGNTPVKIGTTIDFSYYKASTSPGPVGAETANPIPNLTAVANADDSIDVVWKRKDNRIYLSKYSGSRWERVSHTHLTNALDNIAGFVKDENGNAYLATMKAEKVPAGFQTGYRPNVAHILKIGRGSNTGSLLADLNRKEFSPAIFNPLNYDNQAYAYSDMAYGNGVLAVGFVQNVGGGHSSSNLVAITKDGKSVYNGGGSNHGAGVSLFFDGKDFLMAQAFEGGLGLSKLTVGTGKWSDQILAWRNEFHRPATVTDASNYDRLFLRIGGVAGTNDGYLVAFAAGESTKGTSLWNYSALEWNEPPKNSSIYVVTAPKNFESLGKYDWDVRTLSNGKPSYNVPPAPAGFRTRVVARPANSTSNFVRPKLVDLRNGKYVLIWEQRLNTSATFFRTGVAHKYEKTLAAVINALGDLVKGPTEVDARVQFGGDAFLLPRSRKAGWVVGDTANNRIMLHTLDENLNLSSTPLAIP